MDRLKRIGYAALALAVIAGAPGCEESTSRPDPPKPPPQLQLELFSERSPATHQLPDDDVFDIMVDSQGTVWMATDQGVAMIDRTNPAVKFDDFSGIPNRKTRSLIEFAGKVHVGTWGGGVASFNGTTWDPLPVRDDTQNGTIDGQITDMVLDPNAAFMWIGTVAGLTRFENAPNKPMDDRFAQFSNRLDDSGTRLPEWRDVTSLFMRVDPTRGKELWVSRRKDGIIVIRFPGETKYRTSNSAIPSQLCNGVTYDAVSGKFWSVYADRGLASVDVASKQWTSFGRPQGLDSDLVHSIAVRSNGDIWFGTQTGVTRRAADGTLTNFVAGSGLPAPRVRKVYVDEATDDVWLGFVEGGAARVLNP